MQFVRFALTLIAFCFSSTILAEIYQWTDLNGRVQYSDVSPSDGTPYKARPEFDLPYVHSADPVKPQRSYQSTKPKVSKPQATMIERTRIGRNNDHTYPCKGYLEELEAIQERMRKGYNIRLSDYYHKRKRKISDLYFKECR
ncbi:DUF4124 domain-containing protein [Zhongshania aquimaris]|uniref:DUF4124 domain-containing protein n=1 Tax=Zhongshania aquimaris TaxID=2857107 RepID=A0ABS6VQB5_9GAMM|nr:DUF4124 domain-containing protein [Zhongshania aquimaris]MBW2940502.1 DUF4124 domain-containing protein [Zhongshania aquimaris]